MYTFTHQKICYDICLHFDKYCTNMIYKRIRGNLVIKETANVNVAYATGRNNTEVHRSLFIHSVKQVKLQYINKQSSMSDIIMNHTGIGIIKIRMIIISLFYATVMQLTSIPAL